MEDHLKERIWTLSDSDEAASDCQACEEPLQVGDEVAECPRCKALHHLACWIRRGGCARHGCPQTADESLTEKVPPKGSARADTLAWLPAALGRAFCWSHNRYRMVIRARAIVRRAHRHYDDYWI